jgi:ABC-2 type transport system ATP-binding protein
VVIGRGRLIADEPLAAFAARSKGTSVRVRTPDAAALAEAVRAAGASVTRDGADVLLVTGLDSDRIGDLAFERRLRLHELAATTASLERAFMELTAESVEYATADAGEAR